MCIQIFKYINIKVYNLKVSQKSPRHFNPSRPFLRKQTNASDRLGPISVGGLGGGRAHMVSNNSKRTKVLLDSAYGRDRTPGIPGWHGGNLGPKFTGNSDNICIYIYIHVICLNYEGSHTILLYHMIQMIHNVYVILNILTLGQVRGHCTWTFFVGVTLPFSQGHCSLTCLSLETSEQTLERKDCHLKQQPLIKLLSSISNSTKP